MKHLASLNKYFLRYKWRLLPGLLFVVLSNLFAVLAPAIVRNVLDDVLHTVDQYRLIGQSSLTASMRTYVFHLVLWNGLLLLALAVMRGIFLFLMRQTIIVMSRHIEYDQKNDIYQHYQELDTTFFKTHATGDLMNRISEDVSRVRMYTGPSIMYAVNLTVLTLMCIWGMMRVDGLLTLLVVLPFPLLAITIYVVNKLIFRKSGQIQYQLSTLTATAQESYSGIRVLRSFVQEKNMIRFFNEASAKYRRSAINLSLTEAVYFPSMSLFIGLSMLMTVLAGGWLAMQGEVSAGNIAEFVMYINMLMFPVSSIGWIASMVQRAGASQQRINEFIRAIPSVSDSPQTDTNTVLSGEIQFNRVTFTYPHTGITALQDFSLHIPAGSKVAVIGKTGSGKSTLAHLLLRMYDPDSGEILLDGISGRHFGLQHLRNQIATASQDAWLFSDTIANNIRFGNPDATDTAIREAAAIADVAKDIEQFPAGYETVVGERGVMLSGGQKQRIVLARALLKNNRILILDECLSAVDTRTEQSILNRLEPYLEGRTTFVITHRVVTAWQFDTIVVMDNGRIIEQGTHLSLMALNGYYARLYRHQTTASAG